MRIMYDDYVSLYDKKTEREVVKMHECCTEFGSFTRDHDTIIFYRKANYEDKFYEKTFKSNADALVTAEKLLKDGCADI